MLCLCRPAKKFPFTKQHGQPNIFFRLIAGSSGANASKRATSSEKISPKSRPVSPPFELQFRIARTPSSGSIADYAPHAERSDEE
jgi:hypothetical protein